MCDSLIRLWDEGASALKNMTCEICGGKDFEEKAEGIYCCNCGHFFSYDEFFELVDTHDAENIKDAQKFFGDLRY